MEKYYAAIAVIVSHGGGGAPAKRLVMAPLRWWGTGRVCYNAYEESWGDRSLTASKEKLPS
jgi:hypothetical protein